ncbi:SAM domain (Sterile alpha motif) domain containing protein [Acanthamoeba castellanii str. Neff]|uniref:SAM domain (Sterile alpha motif) domain containing protein n=1 Tax=Acanthamoeba castellanii (strain ATCC 30010 / Neff) TaxID=1257118 RepID=L8H0V3_ACACF|nr:SAM domain (Sterile alpha motif) domain containing protein [Acanthamoeba castellanii str. Neff]ELR18857.1 SAM domain (Sterile alpha motif) domain containing protein [Acanthamoeba castellanii str. Neff]
MADQQLSNNSPSTPSAALSLPPPVLSPEAEAWLSSNNLNEFVPFLREAGFIDIDSISTITEADAEAIGISQLGARRRLVRAIQRLATTLPPSPLPHPHLTPQHAGSPYGAMPHGLVGSPVDMDDDALSPNSKKKRGPMRCGKCHQWKKTCHGHCTVRCTSFATCPTRHRRAHPELKEEEKEQRRREEEERKRKRDDEKEEKRREKKVRNEEEEEEGDHPQHHPQQPQVQHQQQPSQQQQQQPQQVQPVQPPPLDSQTA